MKRKVITVLLYTSASLLCSCCPWISQSVQKNLRTGYQNAQKRRRASVQGVTYTELGKRGKRGV